MGEKTGLGKLLAAIGVEDETQESLKKNLAEAGKTVGFVGDDILGVLADAIESGKPMAKKAFEKAEEAFEKVSEMVDEIGGGEDDENSSSSEEKQSKSSSSPVRRTPEEQKTIQDISSGLEFIKTTLESSIDNQKGQSIVLITVTKQVLKNSTEPFDVLMSKTVTALDSLQRGIMAISELEKNTVQILNVSILQLKDIANKSIGKEQSTDGGDPGAEAMHGFDEVFGGVFSVLEEVGNTLNEALNSSEKESENSETSTENSAETATSSENTENSIEADDGFEEQPAKNPLEEITKLAQDVKFSNVKATSEKATEELGEILVKLGKKIKEKSRDQE